MKLKYALLFAVAFLFVTGITQADTIWSVKGSTTFTGNSACHGHHPCTETIHFQFDVTYQDLGPYVQGLELYQAIVLPGWKLTSVGPLAPFTNFGAALAGSDFSFGMGNAAGDEIDLIGNSFVPFPQLFGVNFYACGFFNAPDPVCVKDFVGTDGITFGGVSSPGTLKYKAVDPPRAVSTPEPSVLLLLTPALWFLKRIVTR